MKKKEWIWTGAEFFGMVIMLAGLIGLSELWQVRESPEKAAMKNDPLWVNGNEHLISQMKYSVDHLNGQVTSMDIWLGMAKDNESLLIYGTWLDRLDSMILATPVDIAAIRQELGEKDQERLVVLNQFEAKFNKARAFIRFGVKNKNQKAIDNGVVILKDLIDILKSKMDWE